MGYNVRVLHYVANFPAIFYRFANPFKDIIGTYIGFGIRTNQYTDCEYELDGVRVKRVAIRKIRPHSLHSTTEVQVAFEKTVSFCIDNNFVPDAIIAHWPNPMLDIMCKLKRVFDVPICYVAHSPNEVKVYKERTDKLLNNLDLIGFRSDSIKRRFIANYPLTIPSFQCYSGIPEEYIDNKIVKDLNEITKFIYCGTLIQRKYPEVIVKALKKSFGDKKFEMTYIGTGNQSKKILKLAQQLGVMGSVNMLGRIPRDQVLRQFDDAQVFVMISHNEAFGLVYLEAMARGCLVVASRDEGFDGIIKDNMNGFLCKAGDQEELTQIITKIRNMSSEERYKISKNAMETAKQLTDKKAAKIYISHIERL